MLSRTWHLMIFLVAAGVSAATTCGGDNEVSRMCSRNHLRYEPSLSSHRECARAVCSKEECCHTIDDDDSAAVSWPTATPRIFARSLAGEISHELLPLDSPRRHLIDRAPADSLVGN